MLFRTLVRTALLSIFLFGISLPDARAHEIDPGIADIEVGADIATVDIEMSVESILAGIDLGLNNETAGSPEEEAYEQFRAMASGALESALEAAWTALSAQFQFVVDDETLAVNLDGVQIPDVGNIDLARNSILTLSAALPEGAAPVQFGWHTSFGPLVVRQVGGGEDAYTAFLTDGELSQPLPRDGIATESAGAVFWRYILVGFEHIIPLGLDHILFVLGLFFFSLHIRPIISQVTAFTIAHTITLALASLGIVTIPASVVEPLIALSIVYVGVENVLGFGNLRYRTALVFGFGLLHGLGFASVLGDFGITASHFVAALLGFNVGVEFGQLAVILAAFLIVGLWFGKKDWYRPYIAVPASVAIAAVGLYWSIERVFF